MNSIATSIGIDVSSQKLDVSVSGAKPFTVSNTEEGLQELLARLPPASEVHLEASGGYERLARRTLQSKGHRVKVHDPLKAKRLMQATSTRAKTDALDARGLSEQAHLLPEPQNKSREREDLTDLSRTITGIKETAAQYKRRVKQPEIDREARKALEQVVRLLEKKAEALEKRFVQRVKSSRMAEEYELARSVPGVGPVTGRISVCEMPQDYKERTSEQVSSYGGVAPIDHQTGKQKPKANISKGNSHLKGGLHMSAIYLLRSEEWAKKLYGRLRKEGRNHDQAIVAVMRRQLVRIHAVMKRGTPWQDTPPKSASAAQNP